MDRRHRRFVFAISILVSVMASSPLNAGFFDDINPVRIVGNAVGGVLRGIGGVFGQGLAGLAGPSIDDFGNKMQDVANNAINTTDNMIGRRIDQLNDKIVAAINQTDDVITKHIAEIDEILSKKLGAADVISTRQINNLEQSIIEVVRYASTLLLFSAGLFVFFCIVIRYWAVNQFHQFAFPQILGGCALLTTVAAIALAASFLINPPSQARIVALSDNLHRSYQYSMELGDLSGASFYASQLNALDSSNFASRMLVDVADLQRDLLLRPALTKTPKGALELSARLGRIERTQSLAEEVNASDPSDSMLLYELPGTAAMVGFQTARNEVDEVDAECSALAAIRAFDAKGPRERPDQPPNPKRASPYVWLAYAYSRWAEVRLPAGDRTCNDQGLGSIAKQLEAARPSLSRFDAAEPNPVISHIIYYDRAAIEFYKQATLAYSAMIVNDVQFRYRIAPDKAPFKSRRDEAAKQILAAWAKFTDSIGSDAALRGNNMVLAITGLPAAIAVRASLLQGHDDRPSLDPNACKSTIDGLLSPDPAAKSKVAQGSVIGTLLNILDPGNVVRATACTDQIAWDTKLIMFEAALTDAHANGHNPGIEIQNLLSNAAHNTIAVSMRACIKKDDRTAGGDRACNPDEEKAGVSTLADWMMTNPGRSEPSATRVAFVR